MIFIGTNSKNLNLKTLEGSVINDLSIEYKNNKSYLNFKNVKTSSLEETFTNLEDNILIYKTKNSIYAFYFGDENLQLDVLKNKANSFIRRIRP